MILVYYLFYTSIYIDCIYLNLGTYVEYHIQIKNSETKPY